MNILGYKENINENYLLIKTICKKKRMKIGDLCNEIGITRQHLHRVMHDKKLKNKYFDKIENILDIKLERYNIF